ncbi:UNVERIFIED_CONTAM: hypothetical protein PYX00_002580 [Menopon gallinae]|uniref:Uncharacterized protein n=1 Tax=Menopon gallinae TaxID=328185 RepID=A0AAW2II81_9NEOP
MYRLISVFLCRNRRGCSDLFVATDEKKQDSSTSTSHCRGPNDHLLPRSTRLRCLSSGSSYSSRTDLHCFLFIFSLTFFLRALVLPIIWETIKWQSIFLEIHGKFVSLSAIVNGQLLGWMFEQNKKVKSSWSKVRDEGFYMMLVDNMLSEKLSNSTLAIPKILKPRH